MSVSSKKSLVTPEVSCLEENSRGQGPLVVTTVHLIIMRSGLFKADLNEGEKTPMAARELCVHRKESYHHTECQLQERGGHGTRKPSLFRIIASMWHVGVQDLALLGFPLSLSLVLFSPPSPQSQDVHKRGKTPKKAACQSLRRASPTGILVLRPH